MSIILFLIIIGMIIMWHCEPNMMRDIVAKGKMYYDLAKKKMSDIRALFKFKG